MIFFSEKILLQNSIIKGKLEKITRFVFFVFLLEKPKTSNFHNLVEKSSSFFKKCKFIAFLKNIIMFSKHGETEVFEIF